MLYGLEWLDPNTDFPPKDESDRISTYKYYAGLFDINPFDSFGNFGNRLIANFDEYFRIPLLLGHQRLITIKLVDMVVGSAPSITVNDDDNLTDLISEIRDRTDFDSKLYQALIDYSRYGVTVFRVFNDDDFTEDKGNFAVWDPGQWFPILRKDGTKRIKEHLLVWRVNFGTASNPNWYLEVQRHPIKGGYYIEERYAMDGAGTNVRRKLYSKRHSTGGMPCLVQYAANLPTTSNIYGTSDYKIINELVFKATERMRQILQILDKHADPSMTGPTTMLSQNATTGELEFKQSKFYAVSAGEEHPEYMTWDGKLDSAFKALEVLLQQIYVMSEMGEALMGETKGNAGAVSGTAMRYKMVAPLEKARRVENAFTLPVKRLVATLLRIETGKEISYQDVNVIWEDSLPKDPREIAELTRLQTGAPQILPLKNALMENYDMDTEDAKHYIESIEKEQETWLELKAKVSAYRNPLDNGTGMARPGDKDNPAAGPNPKKKGSPNEPNPNVPADSRSIREDSK